MATAPPQQQEGLVKLQTSPLILELATEWKMTPVTMINTLKATVFPQKDKQGNQIIVSDGQLVAFLQVCEVYKLNPFVKEIYAFPTKGGGIVPMVPIDGWANIVNRNEQMDGVEFVDEWETDTQTQKRSLFSTTCILYRKDRGKPIRITEYMQECFQPGKDPWLKWPARMLRHKAFIQCARIAFSLAGIYDPDEAERIAESENHDKTQQITRPSRIVEGTHKESAAEPVLSTGHDAGAAQTEAGVSSGLASSQAPASATSGMTADPQTCACTCCKNKDCSCSEKDEFERCDCQVCVSYVKMVQANPERQIEIKEEEIIPDSKAAGGSEPAAEDIFGGKPKPAGPYVPQGKAKKIFAVARAAGVQVGDNHDDELHRLLKSRFNISSTNEIPEAMFDDVLKAVGGDKLKLK